MSQKRGPKMSEPAHEDVLQFVQKKSEPFVTTGDVAEQFPDVSEKTVRQRLKDLANTDSLQTRKIGPHAKVWYLPNQAKPDASSDSPSSLSQ
jgi:predicted ArsR family transcriptional regulator